MSNELQIPKTSAISEHKVFTQTGDGNVQATGIKEFHYSQIVISPPISSSTTQASLSLPPINKGHYNLFVIEDNLQCLFTPTSFHVRKELALTKYISEADNEEFSCLDSQAIDSIMSFPSIFATINTIPGKSDKQQNAFYGRVFGLTLLESSIKVEVILTKVVPQILLNKIAPELGVLNRPNYNEFDIPHWTIKPVNLINVLGKHGLSVVQTF
jgi:hypothetical protein